MKLNLDFSLYKGKTRLKRWWPKVKEHFTQVQTAHNALEDTVVAEKTRLDTEIDQRTNADIALSDRINAEKSARESADTALGGRITTEATAREEADNDLQSNLDTEEASRISADGELSTKITEEKNARINADNALSGRVDVLESKSHIHANKSVLDGITASDITAWNGIKEQVTQSQLDEAISAEAAERITGDKANASLFEYLKEICFGFSDEFKSIYEAIGVTVYDGGLFGMKQADIAFDGGDFTDEIMGTVDCGGFEPYRLTAEIGAVVDGGNY